jgi:hypothetical protein
MLQRTELNSTEVAIVGMKVRGVGTTEIAKELGLSGKQSVDNIIQQPNVQGALEKEYQRFRRAADIERQDIVDGMIEAIEMARMLSDPQAMLAGWRELAKVCGLYAPEVRRIELTVGAKRAKTKYETLSDEELFALAHGRVIEGESATVEDDVQLSH